MGDRSVEVTEDMRDKAQEERQQGSMAMAEGMHEQLCWQFVCRNGTGSSIVHVATVSRYNFLH